MKTAVVKTETVINIFKKALVEYQEKLKENPRSTFYKVLIKNTREFIKDIEASYYSSIKEVKDAVAPAVTTEPEKQ